MLRVSWDILKSLNVQEPRVCCLLAISFSLWLAPPVQLYYLAQAAITEDHTLGGLKCENLLSPSPGSWKSEVKLWAGLVLSEALRKNPCRVSPQASGVGWPPSAFLGL